MFLLASGRHVGGPQKDTNMASPYKALQIYMKLKHFSEYPTNETLHQPESFRVFAYLPPFIFSHSGLYLLNGFDFHFRQGDSENQQINSPVFQYPAQNEYQALL